MSIRNLDQLFAPASIAVFGASLRPDRVGAIVWRNIRHGGFRGAIYPVNPKYQELEGNQVFARAADLPTAPELAVICTPPATVPGLIAELAALGTRAALVLTAGLSTRQQQKMLRAARPHLLRILGSASVGVLSPKLGLNASSAHTDALAGGLAFVSQSGALVTAMLDWARARDIGFSHFVSLGTSADVDVGDVLDYLASDGQTRAIILYIESIASPRKFMSAARAAARNKPVIVVKAGCSEAGRRAAVSPAAALAGSDAVYDAAISRAGMLRVDTLQDLFLAAETLSRLRNNQSDELTILTNGGGAGVMAADAAARYGLPLATANPALAHRLDAVLPINGSRGNPVNIGGDAPVQRYVDALEILGDDPATGAILFMHAPSAIVASEDIAHALVPIAQRFAPRIMACWLGEAAVAKARLACRDAGIAGYATPDEAVRAFSLLVTYRHNQAQLMQAPATHAATPLAVAAADRLLAVQELLLQVLAEGRELLTEPEVKMVLDAYAIPVALTRRVGPHPAEAADAAAAIGFPVVLKIRSTNITHKSASGGVVLQLDSAAEVHAAAQAMLARVRKTNPDARIDGFTVQVMVRRHDARELVVGASIDEVFGPIIRFGAGGTSVEVVADRAVALPPLDAVLASALVGRTRVAKLLDGFGDTPAADRHAVHSVLVAVSQLFADLPQIAELEINPLLANDEGVMALAARIRVARTAPAGAQNFAIRPYPAHLVETIAWRGREITLRPIRPDDEARHLAFLERVDPEDIRLRIFHSRRSIERSELARLTQIDYEREMAIVAVSAVSAGPDGDEETLGVVRALADPHNVDAEFGILLRSDLQKMGLGVVLMHKLIRTQREHGTQRLVATVLSHNWGMLKLSDRLGFSRRQSNAADWESGIVEIFLDLQPAASVKN